MPDSTIVLYSIPHMGHLMPVLQVAEALREQHNVVFACAAGLEGRVRATSSKQLQLGLLQNGLSDEYIKTFGPNCPAIAECADKDTPLLDEVVAAAQPKTLVADYFSAAAFRVAAQRQIPLVVVAAGTARFVMKLVNMGSVVGHSLVNPLSRLVSPDMALLGREMGPALRTASAVILNTAPGLDEPVKMPDNFHLMGPLFSRGGGEAAANLLNREANGELLEWLERARATGRPLCYVTTGSHKALKPAQVRALHAGFAASECSVMWSLQAAEQAHLPQELDAERFHVRAWMPQQEILALPELAFVLSHCGWGGTLETLMAAKPVLTFALFGDQLDNAELLVRRGCALKLNSKSFTAAQLTSLVAQMLAERPKLAEHAATMRELLRSTGGAQEAVRIIAGAASSAQADQ